MPVINTRHDSTKSQAKREAGDSDRKRSRYKKRRTKRSRKVDPPAGIACDHWKKLLGSGLTAETVALAEIHTEDDPGRLGILLNGRRFDGLAMVFPYFDRDGNRTDYAVVRPSTPRTSNGKIVKYEVPSGRGCRAYFPPLPISMEAVETPGKLLLITEGILKALAASQAGVPCIGLMGVWNWVVGGSDPRELIGDLMEIDWRNRMVGIVFDFDRERKPSVNCAAAELARVLSEHGADARILRLPSGGAGLLTGKPIKQAIDDFIFRNGEPAFRQWVRDQLWEMPALSVKEWRAEMKRSRLDTIGTHGIYLDASPTGAGKSFVDAVTMRRLGEKGRSVTIVPTHVNCRQVESTLGKQGIEGVPFPQLTNETCPREDEAMSVIRQGLVFQKILCPTCEYAGECDYQAEYKNAMGAPHVIATHKRGEIQMSELTKTRNYVTIHETPLAMLRPEIQATKGFQAVGLLARQAAALARDKQDRGYYRRMNEIAEELHGWVNAVNETEIVPLPEPARVLPKNADYHLWEVMNEHGVLPPGDALRQVMMAAAGQLDLMVAMVDAREVEGEIKLRRSIVGRCKTELPTDAMVWINDATANRRELEVSLERPVEDKTPKGRITRKHPVLQIPSDVTQRTTPKVAATILRGILFDLPHQRVGVITHKRLCEPVRELLGTDFDDRIAMMSHYRSGQSRGSNDWTANCDALIVLGTPRVPPEAIRSHLIRLGNQRAFRMETEAAGWGADWWSGITQSGKRVTVRTSHYCDHDWHNAYCSLVLSELKQALGRARSILNRGIPCYLVTTENLGETLAVRPFLPLTDVQGDVLGTLYNKRGKRVRRKSCDIAKTLGVTRQRVHMILCELAVAGRVRRIGIRRGWIAKPSIT